MKNEIASAHWDACKTCKYYDDTEGCTQMDDTAVSVSMGNFIVCDNYLEATNEPD